MREDQAVPTHLALLRGINVGKANRLPMADLRAVVESLGPTDVATYIQSGNVVFTAHRVKADTMATALERAIADATGIQCAVVVVTRAALDEVVAANPYAEEPNGKFLHAGFCQGGFAASDADRVQAAVERAAAKGSQDEATIVGGTLYLHTPDGLGRSVLAAELTTRSGPDRSTMRNWTTVTRLAAMLAA